MNETPTLILINSCHNTMSDKSIEMNLQSTILFTVHDFRQKSTAVFLHFKLLPYSPLFYFTIHNFDLQSIYCQHLVRNCHFTVYMIAHFYFTVHNVSLQSKKFLYSPQLYFAVHDFTLQSTIFPNT